MNRGDRARLQTALKRQAGRTRKGGIERSLDNIAAAVGVSEAREVYHASRDLLVANMAGLSAMIALSSSVKLSDQLPFQWSISIFAAGAIAALLSFTSTKFSAVYYYSPGLEDKEGVEIESGRIYTRQAMIWAGSVFVIAISIIAAYYGKSDKFKNLYANWAVALLPFSIFAIVFSMGILTKWRRAIDPFLQVLAFGALVLGVGLPLTSLTLAYKEPSISAQVPASTSIRKTIVGALPLPASAQPQTPAAGARKGRGRRSRISHARIKTEQVFGASVSSGEGLTNQR